MSQLYNQFVTDVLKNTEALKDANLKDTPERIERMYKGELFKNVGVEFTDWKAFPNEYQYSQIILSERIHFSSTCSHHFVPFSGFAYVAYIPDKWLVGASKMARAVEHYAARPQLQEHLGHEIMQSFVSTVEPIGAMVIIKATHMCMACRGAKQPTSKFTTSVIYGKFYQFKVKMEVFELIKLEGGF